MGAWAFRLLALASPKVLGKHASIQGWPIDQDNAALAAACPSHLLFTPTALPAAALRGIARAFTRCARFNSVWPVYRAFGAVLDPLNAALAIEN